MNTKYLLYLFLFLAPFIRPQAQVLTLKDALQTALKNYASIKAKSNYLQSSRAAVREVTSEALPDFSVGVQQAFGTANGQFGPMYGAKGLNVASSGPTFPSQNWNAAFGALYLANVNWDFFSFGRVKEKIKVYQSIAERDASDVAQEKFQQEVRVAGAYLNLLAAQRLRMSQQKNLDRAVAIRNVVVVRVKNALNAGVDSSLANAEVSNAKMALTNARDYEQEQASLLAQLLGVPAQEFELDTQFVYRIPSGLFDSSSKKQEDHPVLQFYKNRINISKEEEKYYHTFQYPTFSLFGVIQARGSGFDSQYGLADMGRYTHNYWTGINPARENYLVGVGVTWNLTSLYRVRHQVAAQEWTTRALTDEYDLIDERIKAQQVLADQKIRNAISNYNEAPVQVKAASDAFLQKSVLYRNGLSNIVDYTQALYTLNRAETNRDLAYNGVWQALLQKAAAAGDFDLFLQQF
jgi:outer membrane protein TolC